MNTSFSNGRRILWALLALVVIIVLWHELPHTNMRGDTSTTVRMYNAAGTELVGYHITTGTANLVLGSVTVTLSGNAAFTSSSSYNCAVSDMTGVNATSLTRNSGTQFTLNGLVSDTIGYVCIGN